MSFFCQTFFKDGSVLERNPSITALTFFCIFYIPTPRSLSAMIVSFAICSSSFAFTIGNGIKVSNLPVASKSYSRTVQMNSELEAAGEEIRKECLNYRNAAEAFVKKLNQKFSLLPDAKFIQSRGMTMIKAILKCQW